MRTKRRRLKQQARIPFGRFAVVSLLAVLLVNCLVFVHAGFAAVNLLLVSALCYVYFKRAVPVRFPVPLSVVFMVLITVCSFPSILMTILLVISFGLCFTGTLDWNELAETL